MSFKLQIIMTMTIHNYYSQSTLHRQEFCLPQLLVLCVMMHVMYNNAFTATDMSSKILTILKANYLIK